MRPFGIQRIRLFIFCTIFHTDIWRWRISTIKSIGSLILRICQRALKSTDPRAVFLLLMIWVYTASVTVVQIRSRSSTLVYQRTACHTTSSPMTRSSSPAWTAPTPRWPSTSSLTAPPQFASGSCRTASNSSQHPCPATVSCQHHHRRRCWKHSAGRIEAQVAWCDHWFQPAVRLSCEKRCKSLQLPHSRSASRSELHVQMRTVT